MDSEDEDGKCCPDCGEDMTYLDDNSGHDPYERLCEKCGHREDV